MASFSGSPLSAVSTGPWTSRPRRVAAGASVDGQPRSYTLRATQVYRREGGEWKVAHRHGDAVSE